MWFQNLYPLPVSAGEFQSPPRDYLFGNNFDDHQETKLKTDKNGAPVSLTGFFYIKFTGGIDPVSGSPIARHPEGDECRDESLGVNCVVGWQVDGVPTTAKFLYHNGINTEDHPVWMLNRVQIPQPGSFTHFHWITPFGTEEYREIPLEFDSAGAGGISANSDCPGWLMEFKAIREFAFEHGNEIVAIRPGIDNASHLNIVTDYEVEASITPTRP